MFWEIAKSNILFMSFRSSDSKTISMMDGSEACLVIKPPVNLTFVEIL